MRHAASPVLLFVVGLAGAIVGDQLVRLDEDLHHVGLAHAIHTLLIAVPAGMLAALLLREDGLARAAAVAAAGWAVASLVLLLVA